MLLEVGGESVAGLTVAEVADKVRGPAGTKVELLVERVDEPEPLQINVIRGNIELPSVAFQLVLVVSVISASTNFEKIPGRRS